MGAATVRRMHGSGTGLDSTVLTGLETVSCCVLREYSTNGQQQAPAVFCDLCRLTSYRSVQDDMSSVGV